MAVTVFHSRSNRRLVKLRASLGLCAIAIAFINSLRSWLDFPDQFGCGFNHQVQPFLGRRTASLANANVMQFEVMYFFEARLSEGVPGAVQRTSINREDMPG